MLRARETNRPTPPYWPLIGLLLIVIITWSAPITAATSTGYVNGQDARLVLGQPDFTSSSFIVTRGRMNQPTDVAIDPVSGALFVSDASNNRVLRFASVEAFTSGADPEGVLGQPDFTSSTPGTGSNKMRRPVRLAVDGAGRLWVVDYFNNRVLRFDAAASKANGANADAVLGQPDFTSAAPVTSQGGLNQPSGVAADTSGRLWVSDGGNNRVLRFDSAAAKANGANADGVLGQPDFTSTPRFNGQAGMQGPRGVEVDSAGRLWVVDSSNSRVLRFDSAAAKANGANADGVLGQPDFTSSTLDTTQNTMFFPFDVAVDSDGRLWVADGFRNRVLRFDSAASKPNGADADGVLGQPTFTARDRATSRSGVSYPQGLTVDSTGRLWVADTNNCRVLRYDAAAGKSNGGNADGVLGQPTFTSGTPATNQSRMNGPQDVAVDPTTGKVFVADSSNSRVLRFASFPALTNGADAEAVLGQPDFSSTSTSTSRSGMAVPNGVAVDGAGRLWVADTANNRVLRFDNAAGKPSGANADGVLGQPDFTSGTPATSPSGMKFPFGLDVDGAGRLWVADTSNNRVLRFDNAAGKPSGASADGVLGQPNFFSAAEATSQSGMWFPFAVAAEAEGRLWVADSYNHRVLRFDSAAAKANGAGADGVLGQPDFTRNEERRTQSGMDFLDGIAVDASGRLWVSDSDNSRVLRFDAAASKPNGGSADGVLGQSNFTSRIYAINQTNLNGPSGIAVDNAGRVWVADTFNHRVMLFSASARDTQLFLPAVSK